MQSEPRQPAADADLLIEGVILATEGECPSWKQAHQSAKMKRRTIVDCASLTATAEVAGEKCEGCEDNYPSRYTCKNCGVNSPVVDFIPDKEAW